MLKNLARLLLWCFLFGVSSVSLFGAVWHVSTAGSDTHTGLSWRRAFATLDHAISLARPGDEIWLAAGCYEPRTAHGVVRPSGGFHLKPGVTLRGGFYGNESTPEERRKFDRDGNGVVEEWEFAGESILRLPTGAGGSILDGDSIASVPTLLEGMTILNGNAFGAEESSAHPGLGGGAFLRGRYRLRQCEFTGNQAASGGAVYAEGGIEVESCLFAVNVATCGDGGALVLDGAGATVSNCVFLDNGDGETTRSGGALATTEESSAEIAFCTFAGNASRDPGSTAVLRGSSALRSSVAWENNGHPQTLMISPGCTIDYCATPAGGFPGTCGDGALLLENVNCGDAGPDVNENRPGHLFPSFLAPECCDFRLGAGSSLIGRASMLSRPPATDAAGGLRPIDGAASIGAYDTVSPANAVLSLELAGPLYVGGEQEVVVCSETPLRSAVLRLENEESAELVEEGRLLRGRHAGRTTIILDYVPEDGRYASGSIECPVEILPRPLLVEALPTNWSPDEEAIPTLQWRLIAGELLPGDVLDGALSTGTSPEETQSLLRGDTPVTEYPIVQGSLSVLPSEHAGDYVLTFRNGKFTVTTGSVSHESVQSELWEVEEPVALAGTIRYGEALMGAEQLRGAFRSRADGTEAAGHFQWDQEGEHLPCGVYELKWRYLLDDSATEVASGTLPVAVLPRTLTISPAPVFQYYGDPTPELTYELNGFAEGESAAVLDELPVLHVSAGTFSPVGEYPIGFSGGSAENYVFACEEAFLQIVPRPIWIQIASVVKRHGEADPPFAWSIPEGEVRGRQGRADAMPFVILREAGEDAGCYRLYPECRDANYEIHANEGATLTILRSAPVLRSLRTKPLLPGESLRQLQILCEFFEDTTGNVVSGNLELLTDCAQETPMTCLPKKIPAQFLPDDSRNFAPVGDLVVEPRFARTPLVLQADDIEIPYGTALPELTWSLKEGTIAPGTAPLVQTRLQAGTDADEPLPIGDYVIELVSTFPPENADAYDYCYDGSQLLPGRLRVTQRQLYLVIDDQECSWHCEDIPAFTSTLCRDPEGREPVANGEIPEYDFEYRLGEFDEDGHAEITADGAFRDERYRLVVVPGTLVCRPRLLTPVWPANLRKAYGAATPQATVSALAAELPEGTTTITTTSQVRFSDGELARWEHVALELVNATELPGCHEVFLVSDKTGDYRFRWNTAVSGTLVIGAPEILVTEAQEERIRREITVNDGDITSASDREFVLGENAFHDLETAVLNLFPEGTIWIDPGVEALGAEDDVLLVPRSCAIRVLRDSAAGDSAARRPRISQTLCSTDGVGHIALEGLEFSGGLVGFRELSATECAFQSIRSEDCAALALQKCSFLRFGDDDGSAYAAIDLRYASRLPEEPLFRFEEVAFAWCQAPGDCNLSLEACGDTPLAECIGAPIDLTGCIFRGAGEEDRDELRRHFRPAPADDASMSLFALPGE